MHCVQQITDKIYWIGGMTEDWKDLKICFLYQKEFHIIQVLY